MFTPGKWKTANEQKWDGYLGIRANSGELVAMASTSNTGLAVAEDNARLIAAAPDLFDSCRILTDLLAYWLPRIKEQVKEDVLYKAELNKARKVIARVKNGDR